MLAFLKVVLRFVVDVIFGTIGFGFIGTAAYLLSKFIKWLETGGVPSIIISIMDVVEYGLFFIDISGFVFLVAMAFYRMVREIWRLRNKP